MGPRLKGEQLEEAIELQRKCWTHKRIADQLGVHRTTVTRALSSYNDRLMARLVKRGEAEKAKQLQRLDWIQQEAAEEWQRSKLPAETTKIIQDGGGDEPGSDRTELTSKGQCGDPRYLEKVMAAMADQRRILGLDAPTKTEVSTRTLDRDEEEDLDAVIGAEAETPGLDRDGESGGMPEGPDR